MKKVNEQAGLFCLNYGWRFTEEDYSVLPKGRAHDDIYGYSKGGAMKGPAEAGFDDSSWEKVQLPHDWVTRHPFMETASPNMGYQERGKGWYRLRFGLEEEDCDKQILLEFEGMSRDAEIYVNGQLLKRNHSGYNSFVVDMTDMAHFGRVPNTLAIHLDCSGWEGWWYEGAGIYRNVWLLKKSAIHIAHHGIYANPVEQNQNQWEVQIECELENCFDQPGIVNVRQELLNADGICIDTDEKAVQVKGYTTVKESFLCKVQKPMLWSTEQPNLYLMRTTISNQDGVLDFQTHEIGFRSIMLTAEHGFYLNGEPIKLKGFCNHQDHAGIGVAVPYKVKEMRIRKLKELGANSYRLSHNPDPEILTLCDHYGLMVMEENRYFGSDEENLEAVRQIVKNARNHPCVILYSIFNEEPLQGTVNGHRMANRLRFAVKEMDQTRPVLGAFNGGYMESDGAATAVDAVGINYNPVRYDQFHNQFPLIPLLGSETSSAFMVRGEYTTDLKRHIIDNYDSSCALWGNGIREAWRYIEERPFVAGSFVWTGFDYRGEPTPFTWPSVATFFGVYDSCGFEKDACYLYKALWTDTPVVHIVSPWCDAARIGTEIKIMIFTNCDRVELSVNGNIVARQTADHYEQITLTLPCVHGTLQAIGFMNDQPAAQDIQITAGKASHIQLSCEKENQTEPAADNPNSQLNDFVYDDGFDVILVKAAVTDDAGFTVLQASNLLHFSVEGGEIIGTGNGDPNSHEADLSNQRSVFHGLAQVIVRPDAVHADKVIIRASADGLSGNEIIVTVRPAKRIPVIQPLNECIVDGWKLFYKITAEMPDPNMKTDRNDMNSFEPVSFSGHPLPELSGKMHYYAMYRTCFEFLKKGQLHFCGTEGYFWFYIDGILYKERTDAYGGEVIIDIPAALIGKHELTVMIQVSNPEHPEAGITSPVFYQTEK